MKNKIWIIISIVLLLISVYLANNRIKYEKALLISMRYDLECITQLANQNISYLDEYYEGDESLAEEILYNHMVALDNISNLESLSILNIDRGELLRSVELLDAKSYIDRLSVNDKHVYDTLSNYYNRLIEETSILITDDLHLKDVTLYLESGNSNFIYD